MKPMRFKFKLLAFFLFALFALLGAYGMYSISLYGNRWFTYAKNPRVRTQKENVIPGDILDRNGIVLATSDVADDGTVTRVYQADETARRAVVHLLGDSDGQIANGVESFQTAYLYGFQTGIWERIQALVTGQKRHGDNITLTVDSELCTTILKSFKSRASGHDGAAFVMNYETGEVLAMVSLPNFDPNDTGSVSSSSNVYWNRVTQNQYTPGSTFKVVTAAAELRINPSAQTVQIQCTGNLSVDGQVIHDFGSTSHGVISLKTAFIRSCNNAFAQYALSMGDKALRETAEQFGFNDNFLFRDLVVENSAYPTTDRTNFNIAMSGFGQSAITATPVHLCMIAAAVANGGVMMEPSLIAGVVSPSGAVRYTFSSRVYRTAMTESIAATLDEYMEAVVTSGTGTKAAVSGLTICGKTGSAETSLNGQDVTNGLFIGYCKELPYAVCVVVESIADGQGGGSTAAPIARDIFQYLKNME
jgi:penicillin-binding protein A